MTKTIRIENADGSNWPVRVTVENKQANGGWKPEKSSQIDHPTYMVQEYLTNNRRLVIEERAADQDVEHSGLPLYQCHKQVRAAKIQSFTRTEPRVRLFLEAPLGQGDEPTQLYVHDLDVAVLDKHKPMVGWYLVVYEDGYESFSPPEAFESGYTLIRS